MKMGGCVDSQLDDRKRERSERVEEPTTGTKLTRWNGATIVNMFRNTGASGERVWRERDGMNLTSATKLGITRRGLGEPETRLEENMR